MFGEHRRMMSGRRQETHDNNDHLPCDTEGSLAQYTDELQVLAQRASWMLHNLRCSDSIETVTLTNEPHIRQ